MDDAIIEKRARKHIREWKITKQTRVLVLQNTSCTSTVTNFLAKKLLTLPQVIDYSSEEKHNYDILIHPISSDDLGSELLDHFFSKGSLSKRKSFLSDSSIEEVSSYAKFKGLTCNPSNSNFILNLKKVQPSAAQSLAKSSDFLKNL